MSTTIPSTIDKKKEQQKGPINKDVGTKTAVFLSKVLFAVLYIFIYVSLGGVYLYFAKIAQSNILPTDTECAPYAGEPSKYNPRVDKININIFNHGDKSMKIRFENEGNNAINWMLDGLREKKNKNSTGFLTNYFISILEGIMAFNYSWHNAVFNTFNSYLSETAILLFSPFFMVIVMFCIFWLNIANIVYLWISNMSWFFKTNANADDASPSAKPNWVKSEGSFSFAVSCAFTIIGLFALYGVMFGAASIGPLFNLICFFSILAYTGTMRNELGNWNQVGIVDILMDVFKYFKVTIMVLFSILVTYYAFTTLGNRSGVASIVLLLILTFTTSSDMFQQIRPGALTPNVKYEQASKWCGGMGNRERQGLMAHLRGQKGGFKGLATIASRL